MFTGLVEDVGVVVRAERRSDALSLTMRPAARTFPVSELAVGESIAHDGCCLTVVSIDRDSYTVTAGAETLKRTTIAGLRTGSRVNLERALRLGDRLGGHMVAGHIDGVGEVARRVDAGANLVLGIRTPRALLRYVIEKGSIAIDGISLTVNAVDADTFDVAIIPHTREHTTLGERQIGAKVNLEVDMVAKYVEKLTQGYAPSTPSQAKVPS